MDSNPGFPPSNGPERLAKGVAVAGTIALGAMLAFVLIVPVLPVPGGLGCQAIDCGGPRFSVGNPVLGICPVGATFAAAGCLAGDYAYHLTIEQSSLSFGQVLFHVATFSGSIYVATGGSPGFAIVTALGAAVATWTPAYGAMSMSSGWTYAPGTEASTPLTSIFSALVDVGTLNPQGQGYTFVALGTNGYSGSSSVALP